MTGSNTCIMLKVNWKLEVVDSDVFYIEAAAYSN